LTQKSIRRVSVVGLGKLGLCLAAVLASRGFDVRGIDVDQTKVDAVNRGNPLVYEPRLKGLIKSNAKRLAATTRYDGEVADTDATFVVVPTPSDESGAFSLEYVEPVMEKIGLELASSRRYHLVVLTSTVMPGSMEGVVRPALERVSGRVCGKDFGLCYNPEFIALGDVIRGLLEPDFILIGESDGKAGTLLADLQRRICRNYPPIERMEFVNAELAKIAVNSFVTMKISFANTLAEMSERMAGGNVDKITSAIGKDTRIGPSYLRGALGYGGPCFPRDNVAFARYASRVGAQALIAEATHEVNLHQLERVLGLVERLGLDPKTKVGVLGLAYKPDTNVVEESQSLLLAERLSRLGYEVNVFDPAAMDNARAVLNNSVRFASSAEECVRRSDCVILATPWRDFKKLPPRNFRGKKVLDCWRFLGEEVRRASEYFGAGIGSDFFA